MSRKLRDLTGQRFGMLTAIKLDTERSGKVKYWLCDCDCGSVNHSAQMGHLTCSGRVRSCGCNSNPTGSKSHANIHGMAYSREYKTWQSMKERCYSKNAPNYELYGGRGITICDEWLNSFESFFADMGVRPKNCTIDRIDVNGNYCKNNCRWSDDVEQNNNRRNSHLVRHNGETKSVSQWSRDLGLERSYLSKWLNKDKGRTLADYLSKKGIACL